MSLYRPLKALMTIVPKTEVRYYLIGVHIAFIPEKKVFHLEASDGHRAARVVIPAGVDYLRAHDDQTAWSAIIPREAIEDMLRGATDKTKVSIDYNPKEAVITKGAQQLLVKCIDGRYPELNRIIPPKSRSVALDHGYGVNAAYLGDIGKFASALRSATYPTCIMNFSGPGDSCRIDFARSAKTDYKDIIYVLMPARVELEEKPKEAA